MTTQETAARPHSHGAGAPVAHSSRGDRPTSFSLEEIPAPHGREEDWRFTPLRRIEKLFDPGFFESQPLGLQVNAPAEVTVEEVGRDDSRLGTVLAPGDRTWLLRGMLSPGHKSSPFLRVPRSPTPS